jgi:Tfp pilus assembly protein PilE
VTTLAKGIIIGAIVLILIVGVVGVVVVIGVYGWKSQRRAGNEAATIAHLRTIAVLEIQYYNTHNRNFGTFDELIKEDMLDLRFAGAAPVVDGYIFSLRLTPGTTSKPGSYTLNADPSSASTGTKHFYIDSTSGEIRVNPNQPASFSDPPLSR